MRLLRALALVAPAGNSKIARALRARRGLIQSYEAWGLSGRDRARPLLWVHAPSVGEGLQAQPVVKLVRERLPHVQIVYTFFSPSAEPFAARIPADFRAYLPFDHSRDVRAALAALAPSALIFCKSDVWPNLVEEAARRGVRVGLISGTLPATSARLRAPAAAFLRDAFRVLETVGAIDPADAARLRQLGVAEERISVTGDTRFDQVWERAAAAAPPTVERLRSPRPTLVAGSTWPSDEEVLIPAVRAARRQHPGLRLILAPHEVTASRLAQLERVLAPDGSVARASGAIGDADVILVDEYGILGDLYRLADIAFVGGGFHRAGLHSVLEPAAFGAPVVFGPQHRGSRDARLLQEAGGARSVATRGALEQLLLEWLSDPGARAEIGGRARAVVREGLGAAELSYALVERILVATAPGPV